jgi:beta-galactosidase
VASGNWTRREVLQTGFAASAVAALRHTAGAQPDIRNDASVSAGEHTTRQRILLDSDWRFAFGNAVDPEKDWNFAADASVFSKQGKFSDVSTPAFDDSRWRAVDLPHDWAVELPFVNAPELKDRGYKPLGRQYPETSIGWYRKVFQSPVEDASKRLTLEFDGVFRNAIVTLNGSFIGQSPSGYAPFYYDITDYINFDGPNVLALRVDATLGEGWFYEGAGIYRHVWLTKTSPVRIRTWGTFVQSDVEGTAATIKIRSEVENASGEASTCSVITRVLDAKGNILAIARSCTETVLAADETTFEARTSFPNAQLWSPDMPHLYRAISTLITEGRALDAEEVSFGIRSVQFDSQRGFLLNDKPVTIKGTCNHQDHAGVGTAIPDSLYTWRLRQLRQMGSNACRTSHNPPASALLDACDRLGMLVMAETRMMSAEPEGLSQLERMVRRDRNHPSIILWSLGNEEEKVQGISTGARIVARMKQHLHLFDPCRPCIVAQNGGYTVEGISSVVDVQGFNYNPSVIDSFHHQYPRRPTIGTETASTFSTRGIYRTDPARNMISAYDVNRPEWGATAEQWWQFYDARPFLSGGFVWTGFDYRGEPTPGAWPAISSQFGILDTCGFPKDNFFYYRAWWNDADVLHLFPHWNWEGREGEAIDVSCHTNLEQVELFLNGKSLGAKTVQRNTSLQWSVPYSPGELEARGSRNGLTVQIERRSTSGPAAALLLSVDRSTLTAGNADTCCLTVSAMDAQHRFIPTASSLVQFRISGPGRILGVGNGDPTCHEPDKASQRSLFQGLCQCIVQAAHDTGSVCVEAYAEGLAPASIMISTKL